MSSAQGRVGQGGNGSVTRPRVGALRDDSGALCTCIGLLNPDTQASQKAETNTTSRHQQSAKDIITTNSWHFSSKALELPNRYNDPSIQAFPRS